MKKSPIKISKLVLIMTSIVFFILFVLFLILFLLNFDYPSPKPFIDGWGSFAGGVLSFIGTAFLGVIALIQNRQSNRINHRLLSLEEDRQKSIVLVEILSSDVFQKIPESHIYCICNEQSKFSVGIFSRELESDSILICLKLKNPRESEIINIGIEKLHSRTIYNNSSIKATGWIAHNSISCSFNKSLSGLSFQPLVLCGFKPVVKKVDRKTVIEKKLLDSRVECSLEMKILFELKNNAGRVCEQLLQFSIPAAQCLKSGENYHYVKNQEILFNRFKA